MRLGVRALSVRSASEWKKSVLRAGYATEQRLGWTGLVGLNLRVGRNASASRYIRLGTSLWTGGKLLGRMPPLYLTQTEPNAFASLQRLSRIVL